MNEERIPKMLLNAKLKVEGEEVDQGSDGLIFLKMIKEAWAQEIGRLKLKTEKDGRQLERGQGPFHWTVGPYMNMIMLHRLYSVPG